MSNQPRNLNWPGAVVSIVAVIIPGLLIAMRAGWMPWQ